MSSALASTYTLSYGAERIPYRIEFRDARRLSIHVLPDRRVVVHAPTGSTIEDVVARVERRAPWIAKQRAFFIQHQPTLPAPRYISGESLRYLGRQYRLKVIQSPTAKTTLTGPFLYVSVPDRANSAAVKRRLDRWYRDHAKEVFAKRLKACLAAGRSLRIREPPLQTRRMLKRWGSCTKEGTVLLNTDLIKAPIHCIDYVIMHELCHLRIHHHGPEFYRLLSRCMPDWRRRKERLESLVL
jgi:predicted metal-dependent hydrolase